MTRASSEATSAGWKGVRRPISIMATRWPSARTGMSTALSTGPATRQRRERTGDAGPVPERLRRRPPRAWRRWRRRRARGVEARECAEGERLPAAGGAVRAHRPRRRRRRSRGRSPRPRRRATHGGGHQEGGSASRRPEGSDERSTASARDRRPAACVRDVVGERRRRIAVALEDGQLGERAPDLPLLVAHEGVDRHLACLDAAGQEVQVHRPHRGMTDGHVPAVLGPASDVHHVIQHLYGLHVDFSSEARKRQGRT